MALEAVRMRPPDLILLDINMPDMSGYEVCKQLKADEELAAIPVVFLSGLNEMKDKVHAFQVGGVDYITKPFQYDEVHARVECQLSLRRLRLNLERRNRELEDANRRLREAETLRDNLVHMIVHDMRSPLTAQMGLLDLLLTNASPPLGEEEEGWVTTIYETSIKLNSMAGSMLDISRMEAGKMPINRQPNDLNELAHAASEFYRPLLGNRRFILESLPSSPIADCDASLTQRVIENLIGNAFKFTADTGSVSISITQNGEDLHVAVTDDGMGVAPEHHDTIFEIFGQAGTEQRRDSTGIGLAFCKMAIEAQNGQIGVASQLGQGSTFWFSLPGIQ